MRSGDNMVLSGVMIICCPLPRSVPQREPPDFCRPSPNLGVLPPPLRGRAGEGGSSMRLWCCNTLGPPPLTPPRKGEGNTPSARRGRRSTSRRPSFCLADGGRKGGRKGFLLVRPQETRNREPLAV